MTTWPAASTPWTWNTDLAISRPIVVIVCMFGSSKWWGLNSTHIHGTHVPVEEPSTASKVDIAQTDKNERGRYCALATQRRVLQHNQSNSGQTRIQFDWAGVLAGGGKADVVLDP